MTRSEAMAVAGLAALMGIDAFTDEEIDRIYTKPVEIEFAHLWRTDPAAALGRLNDSLAALGISGQLSELPGKGAP